MVIKAIRRAVLPAISAALVFAGVSVHCAAGELKVNPNIVFVFADDMGWGDSPVYNAASRIPTPNMEKLASQGMRFSDAHCAGALCAPSRFGLLTGRDPVAWKNYVKIDSDSWDCLTMPEMLRRKGYYTACIGKWHFGVLFEGRDGRWGSPNPISGRFPSPSTNWDLRAATRLGPTDRGFDYFFGTPLQPGGGWYCNMEGNRLLGNPQLRKERNTELPVVEDFDIRKWMGVITGKAVGKIKELGRTGNPFFLYLALNSPHKPIVPDTEFLGASGIGAYGDYCHQVDWGLGRVMAAIEEAGIVENTILIFTSDNGSYYYRESPNSTAADQAEIHGNGHRANGPFRGGKGEPYEGGHRIPYLVRWPGHIPTNATCDVPVSLIDHMATFAAITGYGLSPQDAPDSWSILPLWQGTARLDEYTDRVLFHFNNNPATDAVRWDKWKYIPTCQFKIRKAQKGEGAASVPEYLAIPAQLFDLQEDLAERNNLIDRHPDVASVLDARLREYLTVRHSAPHTK